MVKAYGVREIMIKKISKLRKFGIFRDFSWNNNIPDFKRFNLIYGWNKSGKSTISRMFIACERKDISFMQFPKEGEFEILRYNGPAVNHYNCQNHSLEVKVFNKDFVTDNIFFDSKDPCKPIVYISERDIESYSKLNELKRKERLLSQNCDSAKKTYENNQKAEDSFRISTARTIKDLIGELKVDDKYRDYNKNILKTAINQIGINNFSNFILSEEKCEKLRQFLKKDSLKEQSLFPRFELNYIFKEKRISEFSEIINEISNMLKFKPVVTTIDRLKEDVELNKWVQNGFVLHKTKGERENCLFCQNKFPEGFFDSLSKYFSNDYERIQEDLDFFIKYLGDLRQTKVNEEDRDIHINLQNKYKNEIGNLNIIIDELNEWIDKIKNKLKEKYDNPLSKINEFKKPKDFIFLYNKAINNINIVINEHNEKVKNYWSEVNQVKEELEKHQIAVAIKENDYIKIKNDFENSEVILEKAKKDKDENDQEISKLEKKISSIGEALTNINRHLKEFFGRDEIQLELDDSKRGYIIKREGEIAFNLSEGEKNAIAFSYFIVKTREKGLKIEEEIIVIDDPVSSFDSNFIFHCFSLIKSYFGNVQQLFILTHNFEFFNLVKSWFCQKNRGIKNKNKKQIPCEFYMVENLIKNNKRHALIVPLEKTLLKFKSEYHYLFYKLRKFVDKESPEYDDLYTICNIARRFLETYTTFKIPTTGDLRSKIDQLHVQNISKIEKDKVYRLIQEYSHGLDPVSAIEHKDKSETRDTIRVIMEMMKESDQKHFECLERNLVINN